MAHLASEFGKIVEEREVGHELRIVAHGHRAPHVPGKRLHVVERGKIVHQVSRDEGRATDVPDSEVLSLVPPRTPKPPRVAGDNKSLTPNLTQAELDFQHAPLG